MTSDMNAEHQAPRRDLAAVASRGEVTNDVYRRWLTRWRSHAGKLRHAHAPALGTRLYDAPLS
eukprot:1219750-Pyramimonas_sp.AAC.1